MFFARLSANSPTSLTISTEKKARAFLRQLLFAGASRSPCLHYASNVCVAILCYTEIPSKTHLHRPSILNSLSVGVGRLFRIFLIFGGPRTTNEISVIRRFLRWLVLGISTGHGPVSKLRLLTVFRPCCFSCTCASLGTPFLARGHMGPPLFAREQQRARVISRTTRNHNERSTARFPRLEYCFAPTNNRDVETYVLLHLRAPITTPGLTSALARIKLSWPRKLFCETITVPPRRGGCDCLGTHFRPNRGLTNTRQRTHRKPPLSSNTPSQDPATCSTSLTSPSRLRSSPLHVHTTVRTLATPHLHCDFTSWEDALGLHTETPRIAPHNAPIRELSGPRSIRQYDESSSQRLRERTEGSSRDEQIIFVPAWLGKRPPQSLNLAVPS